MWHPTQTGLAVNGMSWLKYTGRESKRHHFTIHKDAVIRFETGFDHSFDSLGSIRDTVDNAMAALELATTVPIRIM